MKITVIDLEFNNKSGIITEIALANVDDGFRLSEKEKKSIDPPRKDGYIGRGNKSGEPFSRLHGYLKYRLCGKEKDVTVVGWDVTSDAQMIGKACINNAVSPIDFRYFDLQKCYAEIYGRVASLRDAVTALGIEKEFEYHRSDQDVLATVEVARAICARLGCTITELIEGRPSCIGELSASKAEWLREDRGENSINGFSIGIDIPVLCIKKRVGPINKDGVRDGVCVYYNPILKKCYYGKDHPGILSKAMGSYLCGNPIYEEIKSEALAAVKSQMRSFYMAKERWTISNFIVSLDLFAFVDAKKDGLVILPDSAKLREIGKTNKFATALRRANAEQSAIEFIRRLYDKNSFYKAITVGKKWNFGGKTADISFPELPKLKISSLMRDAGADLAIPRELEYVLTSKLQRSKALACEKSLMPYAVADRVEEISSGDLSRGIKLVALFCDGGAYAYIPMKAELSENLWGGAVELPFVARIPYNGKI